MNKKQVNTKNKICNNSEIQESPKIDKVSKKTTTKF